MISGERQHIWRYGLLLWSTVFVTVLSPRLSFAQLPAARDSAKTDFIQVLKSGYGEFTQNDSVAVHKLIGDVKLLHNSDTLYCDSAFLYKNRNSVEAFGNVEIAQADGTKAFADYMRYTGYNRTVYMKGGVTLVSEKDQLWSEQLDYNLNTKIGKYYNGGTLQSDLTLLTSRTGTYNVRTRDARFQGDVYVEDPDYRTYSADLGYNTDTKIAVFFAPSVVTNDKSVLHTRNGHYDTKNRIAHFVDRSSMQHEAQYIEADTIDYDRNTGYGKAKGRVICIDTVQKATLYCGYAEYNEISGRLLAVDWPLMKILNGNDSLFIKADTFFSEPIANLHVHDTLTAEDSLQLALDKLRAAAARGELADSAQLDSIALVMDSLARIRSSPADSGIISSLPDTAGRNTPILSNNPERQPATDSVPRRDRFATSLHPDTLRGNEILQRGLPDGNDPLPDTLHTTSGDTLTGGVSIAQNRPVPPADTSKPRYFIGFHHVFLYADSMQGKCDSLSYMQSDSLMRMFYNPVLWSRSGQILGDTIYAKMDSSKIEWLYVPRNGIMVSRSGPEKADMFDQLQGNKLWAYFTNNKIDSMIAMPNAASIYFLKDEADAYIGASEAQSEKIEIHFDTTGTGQKMRRIYYRKDVQQTMTPMQEVAPSQLRLSRFSWREAERPKSLEEFLRGTEQQHEPALSGDSAGEAPGGEPNNANESPVPSFSEVLKKEHANKRREAHEQAAPVQEANDSGSTD